MTDEPQHAPTRSAPGWRALAIGGFGAGIAIIALLVLHDQEPPQARFVVTEQDNASVSVGTDPLMAELLRCRSLAAGSDDAACRAAWGVNRRRFMGETRSLILPTPVASSPASAGTAEGR